MTETITLDELAQTPTGQQVLAEREAQVKETADEERRQAKLTEYTADFARLTEELEEANAKFTEDFADCFYAARRLRDIIIEHRQARSRVTRHGGEIEKPRQRHERKYYQMLREHVITLQSLMTLP